MKKLLICLAMFVAFSSIVLQADCKNPNCTCQGCKCKGTCNCGTTK